MKINSIFLNSINDRNPSILINNIKKKKTKKKGTEQEFYQTEDEVATTSIFTTWRADEERWNDYHFKGFLKLKINSGWCVLETIEYVADVGLKKTLIVGFLVF